jgi:hypothetical protein
MKEISVEFRFTPDEAVLATVEITKCVFKKFNTFLPWTGAFLLLINIPVIFAPTHFPGHMFIPVIAGVICIAVG